MHFKTFWMKKLYINFVREDLSYGRVGLLLSSGKGRSNIEHNNHKNRHIMSMVQVFLEPNGGVISDLGFN